MSLATFEMSMEDVRQAEPSSHAGPSTPPPASRPSPGASRPPLRILIVEDDQFTRQALEGMLNSMAQSPLLYGLPAMRLEIHAASSGETGWQTLTGMPIDIAFIDLGLPGITGFDLSWFYLSKDAAPGASRPHDTAMIACSSADVTPEKLHEAGMHDFLKKPVTMPALRHIIHKWLPTPSDLPQVQLPPSPSRTNRGAFAARVLHVEPCPITASNTQCLMQQLGVWVDSVETGEQAMRHLDKSGRRGDGPSSPRRVYDLVLVEMALPGMSGYALASWYRDLCAREDDGRPRADVAALTAEPDATLCAEFGIDFCLPKPLTADMCARVLCEWIKERNERLSALGKRAGSPCGDDADSFRTASSKEDSGNDLPILEWGSDSIKSRAG